MCVDITGAYTIRRDRVAYNLFIPAESEEFISPFALLPLRVGKRKAKLLHSSGFIGSQIGFSRFLSIYSAKNYMKSFRDPLTSKKIFKSIIPAGTNQCIGRGLKCIKSPVIIQTREAI